MSGLVAIGVGLVVVALLGPLVGGRTEYHVGETLRNQTLGLDVVSLLIVAPLCSRRLNSRAVDTPAAPSSRLAAAPTRRTCSCSTSSVRST